MTTKTTNVEQQYLPRDAVLADFDAIAAAFRRAVAVIPSKLAPLLEYLDGAQLDGAAEDFVRPMLNRWADDRNFNFDGDGIDPDPTA